MDFPLRGGNAYQQDAPGVNTYVYPNPFSPGRHQISRIKYEVLHQNHVRIRLFDFGMQAQFSESISAGVVIKDLLASYKWNTADFYGDDFNRTSGHHFPVRIKFGISAIIPVSLLLSAEFEKRLNDPDTVFNRINSSFLRYGGSYQMHERFTVRSGVRLYELTNDPGSAISAGFSIHLPYDKFSPSIDYAFAEESNRVANLHVLALRLHI